jgi:hypothetical protein
MKDLAGNLPFARVISPELTLLYRTQLFLIQPTLRKTTHKSRSAVANFGVRFAVRVSSLIHSTLGAPTHNEGHVRLLSALHQDFVDEDIESILDAENWEQQVDSDRLREEERWDRECDEREKALCLIRLMLTGGVSAQHTRQNRPRMIRNHAAHQVVQIQPPTPDLARSKRASLHYTKPLASFNSQTTTPMYEQQTGVVRNQDGDVEVGRCDGSSTSSLRRRGAVRRKANPIFARPSSEDFHHQ